MNANLKKYKCIYCGFEFYQNKKYWIIKCPDCYNIITPELVEVKDE